DQEHRVRVKLVRVELGIVVRSQQVDREGLCRRLDRVQVGERAGRRGQSGGSLEDRKEVGSQPGQTCKEKTKDNDPDTWHMNNRPSSRATLERSQKPVPRGRPALLSR